MDKLNEKGLPINEKDLDVNQPCLVNKDCDDKTSHDDDDDECQDYDKECQDYNDKVHNVTWTRAAQCQELFNTDGTVRKIIKARKSTFVGTLLHLNGEKFSFEGRDYLLPIYDSDYKDILLKTSRQVEKCVNKNYLVKIVNKQGDFLHYKEAYKISVGDYIWGYDFKRNIKTPTMVVASESNGTKNTLLITTLNNKKQIDVTENHPIWTEFGWVNASDLLINHHKVLLLDGYYDSIFSIVNTGERETWAIQTENQTIVLDDVVTHNTTFLGNNMVTDSIVTPYCKSLYVSPSHTQTRQFSNEKLRPLLEQSPLIAKYFQNSFCSTQVFEKGFTNGSYIFLRSAFRSADRCVAIGSKITLSNGHRVNVEDLNRVINPKVVSTDGSNVTRRDVLGVESNGIKEVFNLELESGHSGEYTDNHRFLTDTGLKRLDEITEDDWIPIPLGFCRNKDSTLCDDLYKLVGFMLGDGCWIKYSDGSNSYKFEFNNNDYYLITLFKETCAGLDLKISKERKRIQNNKNNYTVAVENEKAKGLINKHFPELLGTMWNNKYIPEIIFQNKKTICLTLKGMFSSDGWCSLNKKKKQSEVGWCTGSLRLANDVHYALQLIGIYSVKFSKKPGKNNKSISYGIKIRNSYYIKKFHDIVGFWCSKNNKLKNIIEWDNKNKSQVHTSLDAPAKLDCKLALEKARISTHALWKKYKISFRGNSTVNNKRVSVQKIQKIYNITKDERLLKWLNPDIIWKPVKKITSKGYKETFDLSVDVDEMFVCNGMFTHNTRGISAGRLYLDEIQDFLGSEIPVIMECTSHFPDARIVMAGTPKSFDNPIEDYWQNSSQNEWMVPCNCTSPVYWNFLDERNIAPTDFYISKKLPPGPICKKCMKPLDITKGKWMTFSTGKRVQGFRIPQLMVPWIISTYEQWMKLLWKRDSYPLGQFYNEVLGLSYDNASKPIGRDELIKMCDSSLQMIPDHPVMETAHKYRSMMLTAGVDWGEGNDGSEKSPSGKLRNASYTILTIGTYVNQKQFKVLFAKKYTGAQASPDFCIKDIVRICATYDVKLVGVDWGHGWGANNQITRMLGAQKVVQFQYLPKQKQKMKWDPIGFKYQLHRNLLISELFCAMKDGKFIFPAWKEFEPFARDILSVFVEYSEYRREMKYDHKASDPDDFLHSLHYAKLASDIYIGKK